MVWSELVKFLSSFNDLVLNWSHAQIISPASFAIKNSLNKDAAMDRKLW